MNKVILPSEFYQLINLVRGRKNINSSKTINGKYNITNVDNSVKLLISNWSSQRKLCEFRIQNLGWAFNYASNFHFFREVEKGISEKGNDMNKKNQKWQKSRR